jgi:isoleucyl-tRNA synthetase
MSSEPTGSVSFPQLEEECLRLWKDKQIFKRTLERGAKAYSFYDGPPFATGLPHYGHLLASTLKDIVPRYWTMRGYRVPRRWGWDCHGLPIEQEIDKKYQFKSNQEIEDFGIAKYNEECRGIVLRFTAEWEKVITRLGRWCDFEDDYKTMDPEFMESVWWVFKNLWDKGLIYRGYKVMAFSTALGTPLSNFEAGSNYQDVQDPAITIAFPLRNRPTVSVLAWTTTPWTLPSNLALAVGADLEYSEVESEKGHFILATERIQAVFGKEPVKILKSFLGKDLLGLTYEPIFDFFKDEEKAFQIIESSHVTTESGTGIVHMAPAFGEDDFVACQKLGLKVVCPVDNNGRFTSEVPPYAGQYVKDADKQIIQDLKEKKRLIKQDTLQHAYPFCPRTDTPLIYKAVSSWFVSVEKIRDRLVQNNKTQTHWVPEHLREGRFGKWLENARDWAISRNRFWGNPLPIFESFELPETERDYICFGSRDELFQLTGKKVDDLHRHHLDEIVFEKNGKKYRRIPEVLDCWFESGSMPYAQYHYPFENKEKFEAEFPAEFIAEGLDQTRGWFYTLTVLGSILFDKIPFRNVVVNGLILAEDGKKMSKRLKNYPDPSEVMNQHGADALRLYLIDSPVIRAEELRFSEKGVKEIVRKVILKLWNAHSFFESYAVIDGYSHGPWKSAPDCQNILDRWMISRMQSLLQKIQTEMELYHLYSVVPEILHFLEELTNTYIRLNRSRFWGEGFSEDKKKAFDCFHDILTEFTKVLAPFAPFISEKIYLELMKGQGEDSVHLESYPTAELSLIDTSLERGVALLEESIFLGRNLREQMKLKVKIPLKKMMVVHRQPEALEALRPLESYLISELNLRKLEYRQDENSFVVVEPKPNGKTLGPKVGKQMKEISALISKLNAEEIEVLSSGKSLQLAGFELLPEDVTVLRKPVAGDYPVQASHRIVIAIDPSVERDQELEGLAREIVNRIQKLRKDSQLNLDDRIHLEIDCSGDLQEAAEMFQTYISDQVLATDFKLGLSGKIAKPVEAEIDGQNFTLAIQKK